MLADERAGTVGGGKNRQSTTFALGAKLQKEIGNAEAQAHGHVAVIGVGPEAEAIAAFRAAAARVPQADDRPAASPPLPARGAPPPKRQLTPASMQNTETLD